MENILEKNKLNLHWRSCIRINDKLYFSEAFFNGLFELDLNNFSAKFICHFSDESKDRLLLHGGRAIRYKDVIYFFPTCINRIHYYNFITGEEGNMILPPINNSKEFVVLGILQKDSRVWLFSAELVNGVLVLDTEKNKITKAEILSKLLLKYDKVTNFIEIPEEGKLFAYCASNFVFLEIDVEKEQIKEYKVQIDNTNIGVINYHEGMFYLIDAFSGDLYEWTWSNMCLRKFIAQDIEMGLVEGPPFFNCCFVDDDIYMIPCRSKYVMKINRDTGTMEKAFEYPRNFQYLTQVKSYKPSVMFFFEVINNEIWFYPYGGNQLIIFNTNTNRVVGKKISIELEDVFSCEGMTYENNQNSLKYFFYGIRKHKTSYIVEDDSLGTEIYYETNQ